MPACGGRPRQAARRERTPTAPTLDSPPSPAGAGRGAGGVARVGLLILQGGIARKVMLKLIHYQMGASLAACPPLCHDCEGRRHGPHLFLR